MTVEKISDNSFMIIDGKKNLEFLTSENMIIVSYNANEDSNEYLVGTFNFKRDNKLYTFFNNLIENSSLIDFESIDEYTSYYAEDCCNFFCIGRNKDNSIDLIFTIETLYGENDIITNDVVVTNKSSALEYYKLLNLFEAVMKYLNRQNVQKVLKPLKNKK